MREVTQITETYTAEQNMAYGMRRLKRIAMSHGVKTPGQPCITKRPTGGGTTPRRRGGMKKICRVK